MASMIQANGLDKSIPPLFKEVPYNMRKALAVIRDGLYPLRELLFSQLIATTLALVTFFLIADLPNRGPADDEGPAIIAAVIVGFLAASIALGSLFVMFLAWIIGDQDILTNAERLMVVSLMVAVGTGLPFLASCLKTGAIRVDPFEPWLGALFFSALVSIIYEGSKYCAPKRVHPARVFGALCVQILVILAPVMFAIARH